MTDDEREAALEAKLSDLDGELETIQEGAWGNAREGIVPDYTALALCSLGRFLVVVMREDLVR